MHKMGVTQWFLNCSQGPRSLETAHELGFSFIHINAGLPTDEWYIGNQEVEQTYLGMINKFNIPITAISFNLIEECGFLLSPSFELEPSLQEEINKVIKAADRLNARLVYFPSFNKSQIKDLLDFNKTQKILQYACDIAINMGVQIATENTLSAKENAKLIQLVNRPNLRILLDTLNPLRYGHSVVEFIDILFPLLADQVHIKDGINGELGNERLGSGDANLHKMVTHLYKKGFNGTFILENNYLNNATKLAQKDINLLSTIIYETIQGRHDL